MDKKKISFISTIVVVAIVGIGFGAYKYVNFKTYNDLIITANRDMDQGEYDQAIALFNQSLQYKNDINIQRSIKLALNLKEMKTLFDKGINLMNDKKYLDAIEQFKQVTKEDDKLYNNAQKNIGVCQKQFITDNIQLAKDSANNNNFEQANKYLDEVLKLDSNNTEAKNLIQSIAKVIKEQQDKAKENAYKTQTSSTNNTTGKMTYEKALKILENAYPEYSYVKRGEMNTYPFSPYAGEPAYSFVFRKNSDNSIYVGFVLMDGKYSLRAASGI